MNCIEQPTSGAEYRAKRRKIITLSSGDKLLLKKPGKTALVELMDIFGTQIAVGELTELDYESVIAEAEKSPLSSEQLARLIDVLFIHCIMKPKIVFEITDDDNELWIEEIDPIDTIDLLGQLFEWIDLSSERIKETFFRSEQPSGEDNRIGSGISRDQTVSPPKSS